MALRKIKFTKVIFLLACVCIFLPWFTWNAKMMGYCWGFDFLLDLSAPLFIIGIFLFLGDRSKWLAVLTEACAVLLLAEAVLALGRWQIVFNITSSWNFQVEAALPGYWFSLAVFSALFIVLQVELFRKKQSD